MIYYSLSSQIPEMKKPNLPLVYHLYREENSKGLHHQPPLLEKETFVRFIELTIPKTIVLSIPK